MTDKNKLTDIGKFRKAIEDMVNHIKTWDLKKEQKIAMDKFEYKLWAGFKANPRLSIELFVENILEYTDHIFLENDQYFMDNQIKFESEFEELQAQIRSWWPDLSDDKKDYIRKRIKLLVMLGAICIKSEELRSIINKYRDSDNPLEF